MRLGTRGTRLRRLLADIQAAAKMPRVQIVLSRGDPAEEAALRSFRRPHPRYKVVGAKALGAALMTLDEFTDADDYLAKVRFVRKRARRCARLGYAVNLFDPVDRRADLLEIHASLPERQGRPIDPEYLDPNAVATRAPNIEYLGVWRDGTVVAYARLDHLGDIVGLARVMGHGDHLDNGVMSLLVAGIVAHVKSKRPQAHYLFYDTFFGAPDGLRAFKRNLGFRPHFVRWKRAAPRAPGRVAGG